MRTFRVPPQLAWPLGIVTALAVLGLTYGLLALPLWAGGLAAVLVFVALYLILDPRTEKEVAGDAYVVEARVRARKALDALRDLTRQAQVGPADPLAPRVLEISRLAGLLLEEVQEKRPNQLLSAAEALDYRVTKLGEALAVYRDLRADPRPASQSRTADLTARLHEKTLPSLEQWLSGNLDRVRAGDIMQLEVNLSQLEASQYEALK